MTRSINPDLPGQRNHIAQRPHSVYPSVLAKHLVLFIVVDSMFCEPIPRNAPSHFAPHPAAMTPQGGSPQRLFSSPTHHQPALTRPLFSSAYPSPTSISSSQAVPIPCLPQQQSYTVPSTPCASLSYQKLHARSQSQRLVRPKPLKKASSTIKHKNVQMSLDVKVEKAGGFHAFFVPLCKGGVPRPPPSSPTNLANVKEKGEHGQGRVGLLGGESLDYFGAWSRHSEKQEDQWVENVGESMEVDRY
ncbi:uncharacterized protein L203_100251 [Cryptococcus depauperatus CBS 7841]|uniref:Uncharacterized protein n=1 Tax=Cryptococcus depauperatus CBS 7841 TaxID=1295531 RepID=A0AAJ8JMQ4_9TREE